MPREISEDQLVHYFAGECTDEEAAKFEAWINADPKRRRRVERLRQVWVAAERRTGRRRQVDVMWQNLVCRLGEHDQEIIETKPVPEARRRVDRRTSRHSVLSSFSFRTSAIVASAVLIAVAIWFVSEGPLSGWGSSGVRTITTGIGQRAQIELDDGSRVTLNAESELQLPESFGSAGRRVRLKGQAYFDVAADPDRPFLVHAGSSVTRVLGTKFDVVAYPDDRVVRVVVAEGKVAVRSEKDETDSSITLKERQMASLSEANRSIERRDVDPAPYLAWTSGRLVFNDAPFDEVSRRLRSWYGLDVTLVGPAEAVDRLNAGFQNEPVDEVLSIIAETLNLRYERQGHSVRFYVLGSAGLKNSAVHGGVHQTSQEP